MTNNNYELIKNALRQSKQLQTLEVWIESFSQMFDFSVSEVKHLLEDLVDDESIYIDEVVYLLEPNIYTIGTFRVVRENFGFVENDLKSVYVGKDDFNQAMDMDMVLVSVSVKDEKEYGKIEKVIKRNRDVILGTMKFKNKKLTFIPYDLKITQPVEYQAGTMKLQEGQRVIGKISHVDDVIHCDIIDVLGSADEPGMDVRSVLFVYGIDVEFNDDVLKEIPSIPQEVDASVLGRRMDHRDQYVITIDGEDAKDLDDAIYMEAKGNGYRLYVHIADVAHYVQAGSVIDKSALERSSSVYMVDRVVPMLPKELSNGVCSLHPNVERFVMTCQIDLDFNGGVIDYNIYESIITSKRRMSYNEVNSGEDLGEVQEMIDMMLDCASRLQYRREQAGSIGFDSDESQFIIDSKGNVLDVFRRKTGEAEEMIEAFMVCANEVVASHCKHQSIPILYRVHEKPTKEKMQELSHTLRILGYRMKGSLDDVHPKTIQKALEFFEGKPEYPVVSRLMLRSMSKAKYSETPVGHFGLALEDYAHFTSPIRRYPDLLLHQRLKKYLLNHDFSHFDQDELATIEAGKHTSSKERSILDAERQVEKIKKAQFMSDKIGERYTGFISGVSNFGIFVELPNTIEGLVHVRTLRDDYYQYDAAAQKMMGERTKKVYAVGQQVKVKLVAVDELEHSIQFEFIEPRKRGVKHHGRRRKKS
ncbi:MAG: ribonuclease R [Erysipelothrix sp.]